MKYRIFEVSIGPKLITFFEGKEREYIFVCELPGKSFYFLSVLLVVIDSVVATCHCKGEYSKIRGFVAHYTRSKTIQSR